jgi:hypothetical protein
MKGGIKMDILNLLRWLPPIIIIAVTMITVIDLFIVMPLMAELFDKNERR